MDDRMNARESLSSRSTSGQRAARSPRISHREARQPERMNKRRILIVDPHDESRVALCTALAALRHDAIAIATPDEARARTDIGDFDVVISDIVVDDEEAAPAGESRIAFEARPTHDAVKVFRVDAIENPLRPYAEGELRAIVEAALERDARSEPHKRERIEFELPSDLSLMDAVLRFLVERAAGRGLVGADHSHLYVALDEAFVNAVIHGNRRDANKFVRIITELTEKEARFTIEDEGAGFDRASLPDPRDPANLLKASGRGVLLIHNIMDEVEYNERGNRLTMVKRVENA